MIYLYIISYAHAVMNDTQHSCPAPLPASVELTAHAQSAVRARHTHTDSMAAGCCWRDAAVAAAFTM